MGRTEYKGYHLLSTIKPRSAPPTPKASTFPSSSLYFNAAASISPSVPSLSMLTFSPSMVTSTALSRLEEPMLMLTARFMGNPPGDRLRRVYTEVIGLRMTGARKHRILSDASCASLGYWSDLGVREVGAYACEGETTTRITCLLTAP